MTNPHGLVRSDRKEIAASVLRPYLTAKKDRTILTQYGRIAPGPDGRVRTVLSPVVTETSRLASGESFVDPASTNLQNLSKKESYKDQLYRVRDCFIADPGMVLLASDLDKAESVVMAFESDNWEFYEKIIRGEDTHAWVASQAYHSGNIKSVTKPERQRCKNVFFASLYMAGIPKITSTINADATSKADKLTEDEVQVVYDAIMDILHLNVWWDRVWNDLMDPDTHGGVRWLENALGLRRMFYNPDNHKLHKEAVNFFPQSTVATRINDVMIWAWNEIEEPGECEMILQVHDEILWQVREDKTTHYGSRIKEAMQSSFTARGRSVYIPASVESGRRWDGYRGAEHEPLDPDNTLQRMQSLAC